MIKVKFDDTNGYYLFKLDDFLKEKNLSITKLSKITNTDIKVIKRLLTGELVRIDIFVLARMCEFFHCSIEELIEYVRKDI